MPIPSGDCRRELGLFKYHLDGWDLDSRDGFTDERMFADCVVDDRVVIAQTSFGIGIWLKSNDYWIGGRHFSSNIGRLGKPFWLGPSRSDHGLPVIPRNHGFDLQKPQLENGDSNRFRNFCNRLFLNVCGHQGLVDF